MKNHISKFGVVIAMGVVLVAGIAYPMTRRETPSATNNTKTTTAADSPQVPETTDQTAVAANTTAQNELLNYLIEEEKLAHDVYTVMYDTYGAKVFGNILQSEQTHQGEVLKLLQARNLPDPRASELGKFNNTELQALYDQLIAQGKNSAEDAYKVGVAIEEKDIADITKQLATATDSDIVAALEKLRTGSENHLRAFNRQLSRY